MPAPTPPIFNIFVHELVTIITDHHGDLAELKKPPFSYNKTRAILAPDQFPYQMSALKSWEIAQVEHIYGPFQRDEQLRLYAALIALGVQSQLTQFKIPGESTVRHFERAREIALEIFTRAFLWLSQEDKQGRNPFLRGFQYQYSSIEATPGTSIIDEFLEAVIAAYNEGARLTAIGGLSEDTELKINYNEESLLHFRRALKLLERALPSLRATPEWQYWYSEVQKSLDMVQEELA